MSEALVSSGQDWTFEKIEEVYQALEVIATEKYRIRLFHMAHTFLPGHRIRLEVTSSSVPMFNPNQNTGNPVATDTEWNIAHQIIYHDATRASRLILPVLREQVIP